MGSHLSGQPIMHSECLFSCPQEPTNGFYHEKIECSLHFQIFSFTNYFNIFLPSVPKYHKSPLQLPQKHLISISHVPNAYTCAAHYNLLGLITLLR